jgi:hypothetical protein
MKALLTSMVVLAVSVSASGQRIESQRADRNVVRRVQTRIDHLTVIELAEPVMMAAAGSPAFKIERQGNKVLIQPVEENAATNLFIWTASGRFSYELMPAPSIEATDFAIDQESYAKATTQAQTYEPTGSTETESGVRITGASEKDGRLIVEYEAETSTVPEVFELKSPQSELPLRNMRHTQLDSASAASIRTNGQRRLSVKDSKAIASSQPGQHVSGSITLSYKAKDSEPSVLRFVFRTTDSQSTSVLFVL